jgi:polyene macrolide polyketide synthase
MTALYKKTKDVDPISDTRLSAYEWITHLLSQWAPAPPVVPTLLIRASEPISEEMAKKDWQTSLDCATSVIDTAGNHYNMMGEFANTTAQVIHDWLINLQKQS